MGSGDPLSPRGGLVIVGESDERVEVREPAPDALRVGVGNPYRRPGRTQLELRSDGSVSVATYLRDSVERDSVTVDAEFSASIIDACDHALDSWDPRARLAREDDEPLYRIELLQGPLSAELVLLTERELEANGCLRCVRDALRAIAAKAGTGRHVL